MKIEEFLFAVSCKERCWNLGSVRRFLVTTARIIIVPLLTIMWSLNASAQTCNANDDLGGTVFRDFNSDGVKGAFETGQGSITVNAYDADNALLATTAVNNDGQYLFPGLFANNDDVRIEFVDLPDNFQSASAGDDSATSVQFHTAGKCDADFGVVDPGQYCEDNPSLYAGCYIDRGSSDYSTASDAGVAVPYNESGNAPAKSFLVTEGAIGSTWGVSQHRPSGKLFTSSYLKVRTTLGPDGSTGAIYQIIPQTGGGNAAASLFVDLNAAGLDTGFNPHPDPTDSCVSGIPGGPADGIQACRFHGIDPDSPVSQQPAALVGQWGLGDIDFSPDFSTLFAVDLKDKSVISIPVDIQGNANGAPSEANLSAYFNDCADGDWQPFGLGKNNGLMYLGAVCTARTSGDVQDLDAILYSFDPAAPATLTQVFKFDLDYNRDGIIRSCAGADGGFGYADPCRSEWQFWTEDFNNPPTDADDLPANKKLDAFIRKTGQKYEVIHPQPMFSDIVFDGQYVYLGLRDRAPDQYNNDVGNPYDLSDTRTWSAVSAGDVLCAFDDGTGYQLENDGDCGNRTSALVKPNEGPGNDEFFDDGGSGTQHFEESFGSLAQLPNTGQLVFTSMNPTDTTSSGGFAIVDVASGNQARGIRLYSKDDGTANFSKASGLGGSELVCLPAPIEIGNRVWRDDNANGIQDPAEVNIAGVTVQLYAWNDAGAAGVYEAGEIGGAPLATAITGPDGEYYFGPRSGDPSLGTITLTQNTQYLVVIDTTQTALVNTPEASPITTATAGLAAGETNTGTSDASNQLHDSNGLSGIEADLVIAPVTTGLPGQNDHTFDFGFLPPLDFGDAPNTYSTLTASNGPSHTIIPDLRLGAELDDELDGVPSTGANGDDMAGAPDDEDAIIIADQAVLSVADTNGDATTSYQLTDISLVNNTGGLAFLVGYIDFNGNGVFETSERSVTSLILDGTNTASINFNGISDIVAGPTYLRLRLSTDSASVMQPVGSAPDGEIEDHPIEIKPVVRSLKVLVPNTDANTFNFSISSTPVTIANGIGDGGATTYVPFSAGTPLTLSETNVTDGGVVADAPISTQAICRDENGSVVLTGTTELLADGATSTTASVSTGDFVLAGTSKLQNTITCTWTNLALATVSFIKQTNPAGSTQNFNFAVDVEDGVGNNEDYDGLPGNNFTLSGAAPNNQISNTVDISDTVTGGIVRVREGVADGWLISGVSCIANDVGGALTLTVNPPVPRNGASFPSPEVVDQEVTGLENGDTLSCIYENVQLTSLGSTLWVESPTAAPNGVQDAGEAVIAGATVRLLNSDGSPASDALGNAATTTTSPAGEYFFNDLLPGDYLVQVDLESTNTAIGVSDITNLLPTTTQVATPNNDVNLDSNIDLSSTENDAANQVWTSGVVTLLGGSEPSDEAVPGGAVDSDQPGQDIGGANERQDNTGNMTVDFGFFDPYSVGSVAFLDNNNNGLQDAGEVGINNVAVQLFASDGVTEINVGPDGVLGTADDAGGGLFTDTTGAYNFSGLPAGEYVVRFARLAGFAPSSIQEIDPDTDTNLDSNLVVVSPSDAFFNTGVVTLGLNGPEPLTGAELDPDAVAELDPSNTSDNHGNLTVDAGFIPLLNLGNRVWEELNGNSTYQDQIDDPIDGATLSLFVEDPNNPGTYIAADDAFGDPVVQQTTGPDGLYNFVDLPPGNYRVEVSPPSADYIPVLVQTADPDGVSGVDDTDNDSNINPAGAPVSESYTSGDIALNGGTEPLNEEGSIVGDSNGNLAVDFGFYRPVSLGSTVWQDNNVNGLQEDAEPPIQGAIVTLLNPNGTPYDSDPNTAGVQMLMSVTDAQGQYNFNGLVPGDYRVQVDVGNVTNGLSYIPTPVQVSEPDRPIEFDDSVAPISENNNSDSNLDIASDPDLTDDVYISGQMTLAPGTEPVGEQDLIDLVDGNGPVDDDPNQAGLDDNSGNMTLDFGFIAPANLGSFVWEDLNGDGLQTPNEVPIAGAQLSLLVDNGSGVFIPAIDIDAMPVPDFVTRGDGLYAFRNVPPADYRVRITPPAGYVPSAIQTSDDNDDNEADSNIDLTPSIVLPVNTYESGTFTLTLGGEPNEAADARRGDNQDGLAGEPDDFNGNMTIDFGFTTPATIGNYVWLDLDMDGVQDANEDGIAGVEVTLTPPAGVDAGNGVDVPLVVLTGPNGEYLFPDLPSFTNADPTLGYVVTVNPATVSAGLVQTYDEGETGVIGPLDNSSNPIQLDPNEEHLTADFGYTPPIGSLGDTIWIDADDDGTQDPSELGIPNVTVSVTPPPAVDLGNGAGVAVVTTTDENGKYLFSGLPLDQTYLVEVDISTLPPGYVSSTSGLGDPDVRDGNSTEADDATLVVLTPDIPVILDADFGYLPPTDQNNSVGDTVWVDADSDGEGPVGANTGADVSERVVPGVIVSLLDVATGDVLATTITDANGMYLFTGVPDGVYDVVVTDQNNVLDGLEQTYDNDGLGSPNRSTVDLDSGSTSATPVVDLDQDFGYVNPNLAGGLGVIGDTIFFDENDSGAPDDGEGLEGVSVKLFGPGPDGNITTTADNVLLDTDVTDENGNYLFTGLSVDDIGNDPGTDYLVMVDTTSLPNGGDGWTNTVDPNTGGVGDSMSFVTLTSVAAIDLDQDFGYLGDDANSLSGTVWPDSDGDGTQAEPGAFGGVTIEVRDQDGNVIRKVVTDANGDYEVTNLPDGLYTVVVTDEDNVLNGFEHTDSPNGTSDISDRTSKDDTGYQVDLDSAGVIPTPVSDETGDFGYQPVVTNPISLGLFHATSAGGGDVRLSWSTQTEVSNLGFKLYARVDDDWVLLNETLILGQGDSVTVQDYDMVVSSDAEVFALADVDMFGAETLHGPFRLGTPYGVMAERRVIDWAAERAERDRKRVKREAKRQQSQQQTLQKRVQRLNESLRNAN